MDINRAIERPTLMATSLADAGVMHAYFGSPPRNVGWVSDSTSDFSAIATLVAAQHGERQLGIARRVGTAIATPPAPAVKKEVKTVATATEKPIALRIVQIFIADPDSKLPVEKRLIFSGQPQTTDATDDELLFEIDIKKMLDAHNDYRKSVRDKAVKTKEVFLEPIRVRDLVMQIVTLAKFPEREATKD